MDPRRPPILASVLLILVALAAPSSGARLRALTADNNQPTHQKVPASSPPDPTAKSGPENTANSPPPPMNLVPPPGPKTGADSGQDKQEKAAPSGPEIKAPPGPKAREKDKQDKLAPSGPEIKAPPSPKAGEKDKQDMAPPSQGQESREKDKGDKAPTGGVENNPPPAENDKQKPGGSENKEPPSPKDGVDGKDNKTPPSGGENKTPQGPDGGNNDKHIEPPPSGTENKDGEVGRQDKDKNGNANPVQSGVPSDEVQKEICGATDETCKVDQLIACLRYPGNESKGSFLLFRNMGDNALTVDITVAPSIEVDVKKLELAKSNTTKIRFSTNATEKSEIVLKAGKGNCTLYTRPSLSNWNLTQQFSAYATHLTQIYGAYFLFFTLVLVGGTWACCKFGRKRRRTENGIPYQQLEMGIHPQSGSADVGANTTGGWDEDWDDDWDEEEVVTRPPEKRPTATVSSNGLTSRSPNKDGWDIDWDN